MSDIRTIVVDRGIGVLPGFDLSVDGADLESDDGLETAVVLSLFTDRRAREDDVLPDPNSDRRGWWADAYPDIEQDQIGSRLWLLYREKQLPVVLQRAREYARESLQWLIDDGVARAVDVSAEVVRTGVLGLGVVIHRTGKPVAQYRFDLFWRPA